MRQGIVALLELVLIIGVLILDFRTFTGPNRTCRTRRTTILRQFLQFHRSRDDLG